MSSCFLPRHSFIKSFLQLELDLCSFMKSFLQLSQHAAPWHRRKLLCVERRHKRCSHDLCVRLQGCACKGQVARVRPHQEAYECLVILQRGRCKAQHRSAARQAVMQNSRAVARPLHARATKLHARATKNLAAFRANLSEFGLRRHAGNWRGSCVTKCVAKRPCALGVRVTRDERVTRESV